ncbi:Golgi-associated kinase 1B [Gasterosteus aculeatus]
MGESLFHWLLLPCVRLSSSFRRCALSHRTLIIASACALYLLVVVSHLGHSGKLRHGSTGREKYRHTRGLYNLDVTASEDFKIGASFALPTRSNVVYITLKSKRVKPAHIRGTIRPKLRRKVRRNQDEQYAHFTRSKLGPLERDPGPNTRHFASNTSRGETGDVFRKSLEVIHAPLTHAQADSPVSSIRIYSQKAPPWLSARDVEAMRFLADAKVLRVKEVSRGDSPSLLVFEGEGSVSGSDLKRVAPRSSVCGGECGVISSPVDTTQVFAFHLDRVLGFNRTLPAVSRRFDFLHDGQPCPVGSWDASLLPEGRAAGRPTGRLTWAEYQRSLKQRCWHKNIRPKSDSGCLPVHHLEWSKLALFDFLLQIHNRLDPSCCGFRPRREDVCVQLGHGAECGDQNHIQLTTIIHRGHDPGHLVFTDNKGFFDRNEDNLDFRLLEGIKELPEPAVLVLKNRRLRERLLQSLFLDQTYWESQGGRRGVDKLIDVIERRAKVLLTYIDAHGIKSVNE